MFISSMEFLTLSLKITLLTVIALILMLFFRILFFTLDGLDKIRDIIFSSNLIIRQFQNLRPGRRPSRRQRVRRIDIFAI
jgi:hypothetical protein